MTNSDTLKPCPFCGGAAEVVHIVAGECERCFASSNVEFEFKENFVSNRNRRTQPNAMREGEPAGFTVGDQVEKVGGDYTFAGMVVASFWKLSGARRYVVEDDRGVLHVYSGKNLRANNSLSPPTVAEAVAAEREACARIIDKAWLTEGGQAETVRLKGLAAAIRARANGGV